MSVAKRKEDRRFEACEESHAMWAERGPTRARAALGVGASFFAPGSAFERNSASLGPRAKLSLVCWLMRVQGCNGAISGQGAAASSCLASCSKRRSPPQAAVNMTPTGRFLPVRCKGTDIEGWPVPL